MVAATAFCSFCIEGGHPLSVLAFRDLRRRHKLMDTSAIKLACVRSIQHLVYCLRQPKG